MRTRAICLAFTPAAVRRDHDREKVRGRRERSHSEPEPAAQPMLSRVEWRSSVAVALHDVAPHRRAACANQEAALWRGALTTMTRCQARYVFNGRRSVMGYPLNRMCMSFNSAENREAFRRDEDVLREQYGLSPEQHAIRARDVLRLVQLGGNIYYLAKFAGIFNLSVQDVGAQQRGMRVDEFRQMLEKSGELTHG